MGITSINATTSESGVVSPGDILMMRLCSKPFTPYTRDKSFCDLNFSADVFELPDRRDGPIAFASNPELGIWGLYLYASNASSLNQGTIFSKIRRLSKGETL